MQHQGALPGRDHQEPGGRHALPGCRRGGDGRAATAKLMGTDAVAGGERRVPVSAGREVEGLRRGFRLGAFTWAGADVSRVRRAGPLQTAIWGGVVDGVPPYRMHIMRVGAARSLGRLPKGANLGLRIPAAYLSRISNGKVFESNGPRAQ